jgi:hypothetical protein
MPPVSTSYANEDQRRPPIGAGLAFLWVALLLNLAWFSAFAVSTASGILRSRPHGAVGTAGYASVGAGGAQWALMEVVGVALLALALAYAAFRYYTRDRSLDPVAEDAARDIYDNARRAREDD